MPSNKLMKKKSGVGRPKNKESSFLSESLYLATVTYFHKDIFDFYS
jgi:hypothetical protein